MNRHNTNKMGVLLSLLIPVLWSPPLSADTIYVKPDGSGGGTSWADAADLTAALTGAVSGDEFWLAAGAYRPTATGDPCDPRSAAFNLTGRLAVYGGFPASGAPTWPDRDPAAHPTILSGNIGDPLDPNDNAYHVVLAVTLDPCSVLDGLVIADGRADGDHSSGYDIGGGLAIMNSSATIAHCVFENNRAVSGAAVYTTYSILQFDDCLFADNGSIDATLGGGGMYNDYNSQITLNRGVFLRNRASFGGGLCNSFYSVALVRDCTFRENAADYGGGLANLYFGGAQVERSIFHANTAAEYGGALGNIGGMSLLVNSLLTSNSAVKNGGAVCHQTSFNSQIVNCTLVDNTAPKGRAMSCTSDPCNPSLVEVHNSIFWNGGSEIYNKDRSSITITHSDLTSGYGDPCDLNLDLDPRFVDPDAGDYHLASDSPCIATASNAALPPETTTDFDHRPRLVDGECNGTVIIDMGAYEFTLAAYGDFNADCDIDLFDFDIFAAAWFTHPLDPAWNPLCDLEPSGLIDLNDLFPLAQNWLLKP